MVWPHYDAARAARTDGMNGEECKREWSDPEPASQLAEIPFEIERRRENARHAQDRFLPDCTLRRSSRLFEQSSLHHNRPHPPTFLRARCISIDSHGVVFARFSLFSSLRVLASACECLRVLAEDSSSTLVKSALFSSELL